MAQRRFSAISPPASAEYIESQSCKKNVGLYYVPLRRPGNLRCNMQHRHGKTAENHLLAESYENAVIGRTKQFFCQPVLTNRPNDFPKRPACLCQFSRVHPKGSVPRSRWFRQGLVFPHSGHYPTGSPSSADCVWVLCLPYSSLLSCFLVIIIP